MKDIWYAMCVFAPKFESVMVGKLNQKSEACHVKSYIHATEENWLEICVGRDMVVNEKISLMFADSDRWYAKNSGMSDTDDSVSVVSGDY